MFSLSKKWWQYQMERHKNFKIYYGREICLTEVLNMNIDGIVPGCANLDPHFVSLLWRIKGKENWAQWEALRASIKQAGEGNYVLGLKILLKQRGCLSDSALW